VGEAISDEVTVSELEDGAMDGELGYEVRIKVLKSDEATSEQPENDMAATKEREEEIKTDLVSTSELEGEGVDSTEELEVTIALEEAPATMQVASKNRYGLLVSASKLPAMSAEYSRHSLLLYAKLLHAFFWHRAEQAA